MALKFPGIRGLGNLTPELRSNMLRMSRSLKAMSATNRMFPLPNEANTARLAGIRNVFGSSAGGRTTTLTYGQDSDKPTVNYLKANGVGALIYVAQDTGVVYIWDGTIYKSSTFT